MFFNHVWSRFTYCETVWSYKMILQHVSNVFVQKLCLAKWFLSLYGLKNTFSTFLLNENGWNKRFSTVFGVDLAIVRQVDLIRWFFNMAVRFLFSNCVWQSEFLLKNRFLKVKKWISYIQLEGPPKYLWWRRSCLGAKWSLPHS